VQKHKGPHVARSRACGRFGRTQPPLLTPLDSKEHLLRPVRPRTTKGKRENDKNRPVRSSQSKSFSMISQRAGQSMPRIEVSAHLSENNFTLLGMRECIPLQDVRPKRGHLRS